MGLCFRFNRHRTHDRLHTRHQLVFQNTPCVEAVERVIRKRRVPCERRVGMLRFGRRGVLGVPLVAAPGYVAACLLQYGSNGRSVPLQS